MLRKLLLPLAAIVGAFIALLVVFWSQREVPTPPILFPPPQSPYENYIAGSGMIEASSQNISIGSPFNEIIKEIYVVEGDLVQKGDPLFRLDTRPFEATLEANQASLEAAQATHEDRKKQYSFYERLQDKRAVSEQAYQQSFYGMIESEENVKVATRNLRQAEINIERSTIRAPIDGKILQVNIHVGEVAPITPFISPAATWQTAAYGTLLLMGDLKPLQVRIDIDEDQAWRYKKGANATAFVRGNSRLHFPLNFVRIEPYVIPKSSFTGQTVERVDTRVLQVLYNFEQGDLPIYAGQILDVFIEADPLNSVAQYEN